MAKKRSYSNNVNTKVPRDISTYTLSPQSFVRALSALPTVSDRRVFDFERATRAAYVSVGARSASRLVARSRLPSYRVLAGVPGVPTAIAFRNPRHVDVCSRREERKRVLHAAGAAGGRVRRPRRNVWSGVSC